MLTQDFFLNSSLLSAYSTASEALHETFESLNSSWPLSFHDFEMVDNFLMGNERREKLKNECKEIFSSKPEVVEIWN